MGLARHRLGRAEGRALMAAGQARSCPDGADCHHECGPKREGCFRVAFAGPSTGVYPEDRWPSSVVEAEYEHSRRPVRDR